MINWPSDLVLALARRRAVVFLGSGVSRNCTNAAGVRPPLWTEFLHEAISQVQGPEAHRRQIKKLVRDKELLTACEIIKAKMGDPGFYRYVKDQFLTPGFTAAEIHDEIIALDSRIVATPNFDTIFENHANAKLANSILTKCYYDSDVADAIRSTGRMVLKIHGTINTPPEMIFTRSQYAKARHKYRSFYSILEALAVTHTFLFLGCGLNDPDIRLLLEDYAFMHDYAAPHYFVLSRGQVGALARPCVERSLNIKMLEYDSADRHRVLTESVAELAAQVEQTRAELTPAEW